MGLKKGFTNRTGVTAEFTEINRVEFLSNNNNTFTVIANVSVYLNRAAFNTGNDPVERRNYEFTIPRNENIGQLRRKIFDLLLTTDDYSDATEEG